MILTWRPLQFDGSPPEKDDGLCWDGETSVGRVTIIPHQPNAGQWTWSLTASGAPTVITPHSGREATKEAAKAQVERAYRQLVAAAPENREMIRAHAVAVGARMAYFAAVRRGERPRW